jgi:hypothetical protein
MSIKNLYPTVQPSLNLDFANTKQLDPRITFTRTTTARYYDGKTVAKAEENLLLYSQEFENAYWAKTNVTVTANAHAAPDGTTTAETMTVVTGGASAFVARDSSPIVVGQQITVSVFAKAGTGDIIRVAHQSAASGGVWFNLTSGSVLTQRSGVTGSIVSAGNNWYRCSITLTATTNSSFSIIVGLSDADAATTSPATGTTVYIWGAQLEQRSSVTSYTPTTTQPITNYIPVLQTAAAGVARFDHNPVTGESLGLLIEEQRTNLVLRSAEFDSSPWQTNNATISANVIIAPDGTLTGDKLVSGTSVSSTSLVTASVAANAGTTYTLSVFAKAGEHGSLRVRIGATQLIATYFNLVTGEVQSGTGAITAIGNGWYRCSVTATAAIAEANPHFLTYPTGTTASYTGDGTSGLYIWGAQLEAGAFPTSYIPTVASSVTRNADAASMTGVNFSSWYRADEGTFVVQVTPLTVAAVTSNMRLSAQSGTTTSTPTNTISLGQNAGFGNATRADGYVRTNSTDQAYGFRSTVLVGGALLKNAFAYKVNDISGYALGASYLTDTSAVLPVVDTLLLQVNNTNGYWNKVAFYPSRLSNAELASLTTI